MHAAPGAPQVVTDRGEHVVPEQQPFGQVAALQALEPQMPPSQSVAPQFWH